MIPKQTSSPSNGIGRYEKILPRRVKRYLLMLILIILGFFVLIGAFLFFYQRKMIYFPRSYESSYKMGLPPNTREITYETNSGKMTCFYIPPQISPEINPPALWVFFGGNASIALDWLDYLDQFHLESSGILLVDYPGYGLCQGKPNRQSIGEGSNAAFSALAKHLDMKIEELEQDLNILGHSLGAAAALQFAARHPAKKIILLAPFTTLMDMAKKTVGMPLCFVLLDRFDNRARLEEILSRSDSPEVHIFHGKKDNVVPFKMGKQLAGTHSGKILFHPHDFADHNSIISDAVEEISLAMRGTKKETHSF